MGGPGPPGPPHPLPTECLAMPYLNVDDHMDEHPKVVGLSHPAFRLYVTAMLYAARNLTDGAVPKAKAREWAAARYATELVDAGLWHDVGKGCTRPAVDPPTCRETGVDGSYLVHDYLEWNHSREWWDDRRRQQNERWRRWRDRNPR